MTDKLTSSNSQIQQNQKERLSSKKITNLKVVFILSSFYLVSAIIIFLVTNSLSLLSEADHMFVDVAGYALALFAINYAMKPPTPERTYGFFRMEILASLANSIVLILLSGYILYEGIMRIFDPPQIQGAPIIVVAAVGLGVNFIGMRLFSAEKGMGGGHSHHGHGLDEHNNIADNIFKEKENEKQSEHLHEHQQHVKEEEQE